jgi:hypothetical protein
VILVARLGAYTPAKLKNSRNMMRFLFSVMETITRIGCIFLQISARSWPLPCRISVEFRFV